MKRFRKTKSRKMKSVEIELSEWVKFNEKNGQESNQVQENKGNSSLVPRKRNDVIKTTSQKDDDLEILNQETGLFETEGQKKISQGMTKRERRKAQGEKKTHTHHSEEQKAADEDTKKSGSWEIKKEYAMARRERILNAAIEMEKFKKEYRVLAEYHNDINLLQDLPNHGTERVKETASFILRLKKDRKAFQDDITRLSDSKYTQMSNYTEDMPKVIRRLTEDELYVSRLKSEIDELEGEKGEQQFESRAVEDNQGRMKNLSLLFMFLVFVLFAVLLILQFQFRMDMQVFILLSGIVFACVTLAVFVRYFNNVNHAKTVERKLNKIISKQNKAKIKYVNAKNGVDYVYRKYNVNSASELLFQWEQFLVAKTAKENYQHSGSEISYYEKHLQRQLEQYRIQDPVIWMNQIEYLADAELLKQLKKELEGKIEQSRQQIESCRKVMQKAKDDISLLAIRNPEYAEEIKELTDLSEVGVEIP